MGSHRGKRRAEPARRTPSATRSAAKGEKYVGRRVAGRPDTPLEAAALIEAVEPPATIYPVTTTELAEVAGPVATVRPLFATPTPTVELPTLAELTGEHRFPSFSDSSTTLSAANPGKRRAIKHVGSRGPLFKGLPTLPVAVGVATLAIAVGGTLTSADTELAGNAEPVLAANAASGSFGSGTYDALRNSGNLSRDSDRGALAHGSDTEVVDQAEKVAEQRDAALTDLVKIASKEAKEIALNAWGLPIVAGVYRLTATFGEYGLWANYHTGLDFAAPTGTPIHAIANGTVTSAGYDGAYGNKTVITLDDGTELWFCHQTTFEVSVGDTVRTGQTIGTVGSTGHVTGPHLHVEVRPGGGDPVDPYAAFRQHAVTP